MARNAIFRGLNPLFLENLTEWTVFAFSAKMPLETLAAILKSEKLKRIAKWAIRGEWDASVYKWATKNFLFEDFSVFCCNYWNWEEWNVNLSHTGSRIQHGQCQ